MLPSEIVETRLVGSWPFFTGEASRGVRITLTPSREALIVPGAFVDLGPVSLKLDDEGELILADGSPARAIADCVVGQSFVYRARVGGDTIETFESWVTVPPVAELDLPNALRDEIPAEDIPDWLAVVDAVQAHAAEAARDARDARESREEVDRIEGELSEELEKLPQTVSDWIDDQLPDRLVAAITAADIPKKVSDEIKEALPGEVEDSINGKLPTEITERVDPLVTAAAGSATAADAAATKALGYRDQAGLAATASAGSATDASTSAGHAAGHASSAATSASNAAESATSAAGHATAAGEAREGAETARGEAEDVVATIYATDAATRTSGASAGTVRLQSAGWLIAGDIQALVKAGVVEHVASLPAGMRPATTQHGGFIRSAEGELWSVEVTSTQLVVQGPPSAGTVLNGVAIWSKA